VRIGIDFDNTIVTYDALFHRVALERGLIPSSLPANKISVREYFRERGSEDLWTELQGYVYGARMSEAVAYPGAIEFFTWAQQRQIQPVIVSHKTRHPFLGERYDLHEAARRWVQSILIERSPPLIDGSAVFFELTKQEKIERIASLQLDYFIDDLPEILLAEAFPTRTTRILFDMDNRHSDTLFVSCSSWESIQRYFEDRWTTQP
jgi:hypothetical protein